MLSQKCRQSHNQETPSQTISCMLTISSFRLPSRSDFAPYCLQEQNQIEAPLTAQLPTKTAALATSHSLGVSGIVWVPGIQYAGGHLTKVSS